MRPPPTRPAWRAGSAVSLVLPLILAATFAAGGSAQEKTTTRATQGKATKAASRPGQMLAIKVGTIHPVSGPDIQNGVLLVVRGKIVRVGTADKVQVPVGAKVIEYPEGHAYPGLVDAMSTAFAASADLSFGGTNAGSDFKDALDRDHKPSRKIVEHGITTAYVSNRSDSTWRGLGVIIRPRKDGFLRFRDRLHGGVQLRMTAGTASSHALTRQKQLAGHTKPFDALEAYEKKFKDHDKAMKEYKKKYKEYLDYFRKKKKKAKAGAGANRGAGRGAGRPGGGRGRGRRGPRNRTGTTPPKEPPKKDPPKKEPPKKEPPKKETPKKEPPKKETPKKASPKGNTAKPTKDPKAPKKPKYPKPPKKVPAKEALLKVKRGDLPLRVEVHRRDEIRAVLKMRRDKEIPQVTLEHATEAADLAQELVDAGVPVVVTELFQGNVKGTYLERRDGSLPGKLHQAGVAVAIATGTSTGADHLTMKAAWACGKGMPEDAAIRAITLTAAEVLGVEEHIGSLDQGKVADVLITSGPLLRSDTRVLRVISQGQTQFEAHNQKEVK